MSERRASAVVDPPPVLRPVCDPGEVHEGCDGPPPTPWLPWKHCFKVYEFREILLPVTGAATQVSREQIRVRVRFEHALCPMGRKQGPIVHSLTLLPQEQVKIFEYDRYRRATSVEARFSQRSSLYTFIGRVSEKFASTKTDTGASFSSTASSADAGGGGLDLGIVQFGGSAASAASVSVAGHLDVDAVFDSFNQTVETASQAVETERSIVVSSFTENESGDSSARTLRNDNQCRAVTYFIRRVFEIYCLTTMLVAIEVQVGDNWIDLAALPQALKDLVLKELGAIKVGLVAQGKNEIALPTDGLLYEAELAHCGSCEPERERQIALQLKKLELEVELLERENERRKSRLASGDLTPFEPCCPEVEVTEE
jgi:thermitase